MKTAKIIVYHEWKGSRYGGVYSTKKISVICPKTNAVLARGFRGIKSASKWAIENGYQVEVAA